MVAVAGGTLSLNGSSARAAAPSTNTVISIEFDDGNSDQYQTLAMLSSRGMHGTYYINSGTIGNPGAMTYAQLHDLANAGNDIGGHTLTHVDLPTLSSDEAKRQVCNDRVALLNQGFAVTNFAFPYGDTNSTVAGLVSTCGYNSGRIVGGVRSPSGCSGCPYGESIPPTDPFATKTPESIKSTTTLADLQNYVINAEQHGGGWVQLIMHHICDGCADTYTISPALLAQFLTWLQPRSAQGTVVKSVAEVIGGSVKPGVSVAPPPAPVGPNILQNPSLETAGTGVAPNCWTSTGSSGVNTFTFMRTSDAHSGLFGASIAISAYTSGDRKLVATQDSGTCAPQAKAGHSYNVSDWFKSDVSTMFDAYYKTASGTWAFWKESGKFSPASAWTPATWTIPALPTGAILVSFGHTINSVGTLSMDDFSLGDSDQTPPTISLLSPAPGEHGLIVSGIVPLSVSAADLGGTAPGIDHVDFLVNGVVVGRSPSTASPYTFNWDSTSYTSPTASIAAVAVDTAGNRMTTATSALVTVTHPDTTSPTVALTAPLGGATVAGLVTLTATASDDRAVDHVEFLVDGVVVGTSTTAPYSYAWDSTVHLDGPATISAKAYDSSHNSASADSAVTIGNAPKVLILGAPSTPTPEGAQITLDTTITYPGATTGPYTYAWSVTKDGTPHLTGTDSSFSFAPPDNGTYVVTVTVTDPTGRTGTDSKTIAVTNVPPAPTITGAPAAPIAEHTTANLGSTVVDPGVADTQSYAWSVTRDGVAYASGTDSTLTFTPEDNGSYVATVTVTDKDGGVGSTSSTIAVENVAPTAALAATTPVSEGQASAVSMTSPFDPSPVDTSAGLHYAFDCAGGDLASATYATAGLASTATCTWDNGPSNRTVSARIIDKDGGSSRSTTIVHVDDVAPTATLVAPASVNEGTSFDLSLTGATDVSAADMAAGFTYAFDCGSGYGAFGSVATASCPTTSYGTRAVKAKVRDQDNLATEYTASVHVLNVAPTPSITGAPTTSPEGTAISLGSTVSDPGADETFTHAWSVTKDGTTYGSGGTSADFSFTPNDNGSYVVTLTVTDSAGDPGTTTTTIAVTNGAPTSTITGAPPSSPEGAAISLGSSIADPGTSDTFTYAWNVTKDGSPFATGTSASFGFTPDDNASYVVSLTATDNDGGSGSTSATIAVTNVVPTATLTGGGTIASGGTATATFTGQADVSSADTAAGFRYAWSCDGTIATVPAYADASTSSSTDCSYSDGPSEHTIVGAVIDKDGGYRRASVQVHVDNAAPAVTAPAIPQTVPEGSSAAIALGSFADAAGPWTVAVAWGDSTPNGNSSASAPGSLGTLSHSYADNGSYTVNVTVTDTYGAAGVSSFVVSVTNVAPTATFPLTALATAGTPLKLSFTSPSDSSSTDTGAGFHYAYSCSGGSLDAATYASAGTSDFVNCTFTTAGPGTVNGRILDKDGGYADATTAVNVSMPAPSISLTSPDVDATVAGSVTLSATVPAYPPLDHVDLLVDGSVVATSIAASYTFVWNSKSHLNGAATITARAVDTAHNVATDVRHVTVANDLPPTVSLTAPTEGATVAGSVPLTADASDDHAVDHVDFLVDGVLLSSDSTSPYEATWNAAAHANGAATLTAVSVDSATQSSAVSTVHVTVANNHPPTALPDAKTMDQDTTLSFAASTLTANDTDPDGDLLTVMTVTATADTHGSVSLVTGQVTYAPSAGYNGAASFTYTVSDGRGGTADGTMNVTVNPAATPVEIILPPTATLHAPASVNEGSTIHVSLDNPSSTSASATFTYAFNFGAGYGSFGASNSADLATTDDGTVHVLAKVRDSFGNVSEYTADIAVAGVAPTATAAGTATIEGQPSTISVTSPFDPSSVDTAAGFRYAFDCNGGDLASATYATAGVMPTTSCTWANGPADYIVGVRIFDADGASTLYSVSVHVADAAPTATLVAPAHVDEGSPIGVSLATVTDPSPADALAGFQYAFDCGSGFGVPSPLAAVSCATVDNGTRTVGARVYDQDGLFSPYSATVTIDNVAPTPTITGAPATSGESTPILLGSTYSDPGVNDTQTYAWSVKKDGIAYGTGGSASSFSFTPADNGSYVVTLAMTDNAGGVGRVSKTIAVQNLPPTAAILGAPLSSPEGTTIPLTASTSDPGTLDTVTSSWSVTRNGTAVGGGTGSSYSLTPADNGTYVVTLTASDGQGGVTTDRKTIDVTNVAPTAAIAGAPASSPEGTALSLTANVTDPGTADTFTYDWHVTKGGAPYAAGTAATFGFTPDDNASYYVTLIATDKDGAASLVASKTITVTNVNPAVSITAPPTTGPEGTAITLSGTVTDPGTADTQTRAWSVTKDGTPWGPTGSGATFSFTPTDNGSYVVTFKSTDDDSGVGTTSATIAVTNVDPSATLGNGGAINEGGSAIATFTNPADPSSVDTAAGFHYAWSCDGPLTVPAYSAASTSATKSCQYTDGPSDHTITGAIIDKDGGAQAYTTAVHVNNVAPTVTAPASPQAAVEASAATFSLGSFADPGADNPWSVDIAWGDGSVHGTAGAGAPGGLGSMSHTYADSGSYTVTVKVTDKDGASSQATFIAAVTNVAPTASFPPGATAYVGTPLTLGFTNQDDVSTPDKDAGFHYTFDCNNGALPAANYATAGTSSSVSCNYAAAGSTVVRARIIDKDGGYNDYSANITILAPPPTVTFAGTNKTAILEGTAATTQFPYDFAIANGGTAPTVTPACGVLGTLVAGSLTLTGTTAGTFKCTFNTSDGAPGKVSTVSASVRRSDGTTGSGTQDVTITNVVPTVTIASPAVGALIVHLATNALLAATISDPGAGDGPFACHIVWGDGVVTDMTVPSPGGNCTGNHLYAAAGSFTIVVTATDKDGGVGTASRPVTVR
jgi:peptidoglycan/xylan/chitin deacetylase (PgdA/CDA1 family)